MNWLHPKVPVDAWSHDALAHDLAMNLQARRGRVTWENCEIVSGSRPDVYSLNRTLHLKYAKAWNHEVKVSRNDFLSDMRSGKWEKYLTYCNQLYFACPAGLIDPKELPKGVGLWERFEGYWTVTKGARNFGNGPTKTALYRCAIGKFVAPEDIVHR